MLIDIEKSLNLFVLDRVIEVSNGLLRKNEEYNKINVEIEEIFNKIKEVLPEEYRDLLFELDSLEGAKGSVSEVIIYRQGLKDGIELNNILKLVV